MVWRARHCPLVAHARQRITRVIVGTANSAALSLPALTREGRKSVRNEFRRALLKQYHFSSSTHGVRQRTRESCAVYHFYSTTTAIQNAVIR